MERNHTLTRPFRAARVAAIALAAAVSLVACESNVAAKEAEAAPQPDAAVMATVGEATISRAELVSYWPFEEFVDELTTPDVVSGYDLTVEALGPFGNDNQGS